MTVQVNNSTRQLLQQQMRVWVQKLTSGEARTLGPEAFYAQVCVFIKRAKQLRDEDAYVHLLRHFAGELEGGVPLPVVDAFLTRALDESILVPEDFVELANVHTRLLMRREMDEAILELLYRAHAVAETEYQHAVLANREAVYWELKGDYPQSETFYQKALLLARHSNDPRSENLLAIVLNNLGNWEYAQDHFEQALDYFYAAYKQAITADSIRWQAGAAGGIGMTLGDLKQVAKAFEYLDLTEELYRKCGSEIGVVRVNLNRSFIAVQDGRIKEAKEWGFLALNEARRLEDANREANGLHNLGLAFAVERDYEQALHYLWAALRQRRLIGQAGFTENTIKAINKVMRAMRQELLTS